MFDFDSISTDAPNSSSKFKFIFDADTDNPFLTQKIERRNKLAGRLDKLVNEVTIGGYPIIKYILQHVQEVDPEELLKLSKALERVSEIWLPFQKLNEEVKHLAFAKAHPDLMALTFGTWDVPEDPDEFLLLTTSTDEPTTNKD